MMTRFVSCLVVEVLHCQRYIDGFKPAVLTETMFRGRSGGLHTFTPQ